MPVVFLVAIAPLVVVRQLVRSLLQLIRPRSELRADMTLSVVTELTDPLRFVIGAIAILLSPNRDRAASLRAICAFLVLVAAASVPVVGGAVKGTGDPLVYALAGFAAGIFTLIPDRVAELRNRGKIRRNGYPMGMKTVLVGIEYLIVIAVALLIGFASLGGPLDHTFWRGVTWGVGTVAFADLVTVSDCILIGGSGVIPKLRSKARPIPEAPSQAVPDPAVSSELSAVPGGPENEPQRSGPIAQARQALLDAVSETGATEQESALAERGETGGGGQT
jgi:hypothetical protein